jgi:hypothetical protein
MKKISVVSLVPNSIELDSRARRLNKIFNELGWETSIMDNLLLNNKREQTNRNIVKFNFMQVLKKLWNKYKKTDQGKLTIVTIPFIVIGYLLILIWINFFNIGVIRSNILVLHESYFYPSALISKIIFKTKLVVDVHDDYDNLALISYSTQFDRVFRIKFEQFMRRKLYNSADLRITVSNSLAVELSERYQNTFKVLENIENIFEENLILRKCTGSRNENNSQVIRGLFIGNFKESLDFEWLNNNHWSFSNIHFEFDIIGKGYTSEYISKFNSKYIKFLDSIDFYESHFDFNNYDFGFMPFNSKNLSVKFALPNGFFKLAFSNLPLIVAECYELEQICKKYNLGVVSKFDCLLCIQKEIIFITSKDFLSSRDLRKFKDDYNFSKQSFSFLRNLEELIAR